MLNALKRIFVEPIQEMIHEYRWERIKREAQAADQLEEMVEGVQRQLRASGIKSCSPFWITLEGDSLDDLSEQALKKNKCYRNDDGQIVYYGYLGYNGRSDRFM